MRIYAQIGKHQLVALIDSGSTHNFISEKMATMLQLPVVPTRPFPVRVANGTPMQCRWKYETVCVSLGGVSFSLTLFALPLTSLDLVLGVQWLELLGPVVCDWRNLTMEFEWRSQNCVLQGLRTTPIQPVDFQCLSKEARQGHALFAIYATEEGNSTPVPQELKELIEAFDDIFQAPSQLPPQRDIEHQITLKEGTDPINVRPYRYAYFQKDEIERQVSDMLNSGLIRPSSSPFSSPVLLVKKKDGSWRFCTDYRALNAATIKDDFQFLREDILDELHGAAYFTKLDLTAGYHQVRLHPPDTYKTAFRTHNGHYEYLHLQHVKTIFELRQHQLFVKFKNATMLDWPRPTTITELGHFRTSWILPKHSRILKAAMTTTPTALPDLIRHLSFKPMLGDGIGAVLSQNGRPIAFMSRALGVSKQSLSTYAREMLAIIVAIQTWRPYLLGRRFTIQTDQRSLKYLLEQRILTPEQQKWMSKLVGYDYEIVYKPGKTNQAADALSRNMTIHPQTAKTTLPMAQWTGLLQQSHCGATSSPLIHRLLREFHDTQWVDTRDLADL
ncbi:hypothetical protein AAG906_039221 [Vitis piasezkii]